MQVNKKEIQDHHIGVFAPDDKQVETITLTRLLSHATLFH